MALAQKLNQLATANSQGLLNDNEYRLLRQNIFEQHITGTVIPVEVPVVPVASPPTSLRLKPANSPQAAPNPQPSPTPGRSRASITAGFTNLFRRATGRKPPTFTYEPPSPTTDTPKRGLIPRILPRKDSPVRTDSNKRIVPDSVVNSSRTSNASSARLRSPPQTPTRTAFSSNINIPSSVSEIFDDENLHTTKDIKAAILATQLEATRLLDAFKHLESTTSHRVHLQTARRLPSTTSPLSPDRKPHRRAPAPLDLGDAASVYSKSSARTSLSKSKSVSSLHSKLYPSSPLSPRFFPPMHPTQSVSSISSHVPSQARVGVGSSVTGSTSRSMLADSDEVHSLDPVEHGMADGVSSHVEVLEVQQRRKDVMARCEARLEYLQARLKSAELHEKLLRK